MTMRSLLHKHIITPDRSGFTLLELLMVVTILSAVAWMSLGLVNNNMDQVRFDDTKNRLETIKRAIIGDTSRTINGQPEIRGYVADMGNLPPSLRALIVQDYCPDPQHDNEADCNTAIPGSWVEQGRHCSDHTITVEASCVSPATWEDEYTFDPDLNLWTGWNGPYLNGTKTETNTSPAVDYLIFRDGWGNNDFLENFGWTVDTSTDEFKIHSVGRDGVDGTGVNYEADYPENSFDQLIKINEYRIEITDATGVGGITVDFGNPVSTANPEIVAPTHSDNAICMKVIYRANGALTEFSSTGTGEKYDPTTWWDGTPRSYNFTLPSSTNFPLGKMAIGIFLYDGATSLCTATFYPSTYSSWKEIIIVPGATIPTLNWTIL
jgi:prepilin-type N-terminal cleavage/methylation domain-containing protein